MATRARRRRLDAELVRRGLAPSRAQAQRLIDEGNAIVDGVPDPKAATLVAPDQRVMVRQDNRRWASRGGAKLAGALDQLRIAVVGRFCLDAGASTGGFTDVLLRFGAARVVAVDVGYGQLDWRLQSDQRVVVLDRTNARHLRPQDLPPPPPSLVVADLSFISLRNVVPALRRVAASDADHLLLVKPQFEAGPQRVGRGGVVRDPVVWRDALAGVVQAAGAEGLGLVAATPSRLPGPAGNVEFFVQLAQGGCAGSAELDEAVARGQALSRGISIAE